MRKHCSAYLQCQVVKPATHQIYLDPSHTVVGDAAADVLLFILDQSPIIRTGRRLHKFGERLRQTRRLAKSHRATPSWRGLISVCLTRHDTLLWFSGSKSLTIFRCINKRIRQIAESDLTPIQAVKEDEVSAVWIPGEETVVARNHLCLVQVLR